MTINDAKLIVATAFMAGILVGFEAGLVYVGSLWTALSLAGMYLMGLFSIRMCDAAAEDDIFLNGDAD